jgi:lysozyme
LHPYNDATGNATIGFGHLIHRGKVDDDDRRKYRNFTREQAIELLRADCGVFVRAVSQLVTVRLGLTPARADARFAALVSLTFNIGVGAFTGSHVLHLVNEKAAPRDWHEPATAMLAWSHGNHGEVIPGLLARRRVEAAVLIAGKFPADV